MTVHKRLAFLLLTLLLAACSNAPRVGMQTPEYAAVDTDGRVVSRAEYAGKVTVYYFWATWSAPCFVSTPAIQHLHDKYEGSVEIIAVHYNTVGNAVEYYKDAGLTFRMVPDGTSIVEAFGVKKIPTIVIVGKDGAVVHSQIGFTDEDEEEIDGILQAAIARSP